MAIPTKTYCTHLLLNIGVDVGNYHRVEANYTADGVEAIFVDEVDGQKYRLKIVPMGIEEDGKDKD